jgi:hypothetical protein
LTKETASIQKTSDQNKETITEWEKVFASSSLDKRFISTIYKELQKLNTK